MTRPIIKLQPTLTAKILLALGFIALVTNWLLVICKYEALPDIIPVHFNASGEVDGFGDKTTLFFIPVMACALFWLLQYFALRPHTYNYLTEITTENAETQYKYAVGMLRWLQFSVQVIFLLISHLTIENSNGTMNGLGKWFLPLMFALIFIPVFYYLIKSSYKG